jgi:sterol desaturase/sphingolipid hydroxylase (fatty acid hydroxylase superfamily)/CDGSH-type Zn-finger protein
MNLHDWLTIPNIDIYAVIFILSLFAAIEIILGHYHNTHRDKNDWILELIGFFVVAGTKALQVLAIVLVGDALLPQYSNVFSHWPLWLALLFYLLIDDFSQYWYHRLAHEHDWLWKHHRSHHAAEDMGIMVSYRNSWVYYLLMPNLWWGAICTYLGLAPAVILGLIIKQLIVTSTHSTWKWDEFLYKSKWLSPLSSFIERIVITPAFHHAHHGRSKADHISDPNGNFGNTFSLWDQAFGTALYTRKYPTTYGLQEDPNDPWYAHLLFPFAKSPIDKSELASDFKKKKNTGTEPFQQELKAGTYLYCQCGYSRDQPFCNGFHNGTKKKPLLFEVKSERKVSLCTCKLTKTPPYCDNSHLSI